MPEFSERDKYRQEVFRKYERRRNIKKALVGLALVAGAGIGYGYYSLRSGLESRIAENKTNYSAALAQSMVTAVDEADYQKALQVLEFRKEYVKTAEDGLGTLQEKLEVERAVAAGVEKKLNLLNEKKKELEKKLKND